MMTDLWKYLKSSDKPIVMYGSSILQGGCASRPGMAYTNIIGRRFNREVFNLGFSGNARLDMEIAHLMARVKDPGAFVLDFVPNSSDKLINEVAEKFFQAREEKESNTVNYTIEKKED